MEIINGITTLGALEKKPTQCAIGIFDGVHRGHQQVISRLIEACLRDGHRSCVITFDPHPAAVLSDTPGPPLVTSVKHRLDLIAQLGVDLCIVVPFTKELACLTPELFVQTILVRELMLKRVFVGTDFVFGKARAGNVGLLGSLGAYCGFDVEAVEPVCYGEEVISSTVIRKLIEQGDLAAAADMLARPVSVWGTVVCGEGRGRSLGFPTANLDPHHEALPPRGIYAARTIVHERVYDSAVYIGSRPTFSDDQISSIEVYLLDFTEELYGRDIEARFIKKIRNDEKFTNDSSLRDQIEKDVCSVKNVLAGAK